MTNTIEKIFGAGLNSRVAVYVPGTVNANETDENKAEQITEMVAGELSELFGGATISLAAGAWKSEQFGLIREDIKIVYSYCTIEQLEKCAPDVLRIAEQVKREMSQEAVSVEVNSKLYFV